MFFTTRFVSSLEKVFCQPELSAERIDGVSGAGGETIAFQLACKSNGNHIIEFHMESEIADLISLREVGLVPCLMPAMPPYRRRQLSKLRAADPGTLRDEHPQPYSGKEWEPYPPDPRKLACRLVHSPHSGKHETG